jgi:hypothetical protein
MAKAESLNKFSRRAKMAAKSGSNNKVNSVFKRTSQGGNRPKTSSMSKVQKRNHKAYRGQGR